MRHNPGGEVNPDEPNEEGNLEELQG